MLDSLLKESVAAWGTEALLREKTREETETNVFNMHYSYHVCPVKIPDGLYKV